MPTPASPLARFASKLAEIALEEFGTNFPIVIQTTTQRDAIELKIIDHGTGLIPSYMWSFQAMETFADMADVVIREGIESIKDRMTVFAEDLDAARKELDDAAGE